MFLGTIVNATLIIIGSLMGLGFKKGIPKGFETIILNGIALTVCVMGIDYALASTNILQVIVSIVLGSIIGEWWNIERALEKFGNNIKKKLLTKIKFDNSTFVEGMMTATLLYCVGSMTIMGALDSGLRGEHSILFTKSFMDGITSILFANSMGIGVMFSVIPLVIYQGLITLFAATIEPFLDPMLIEQISAVGGILLIGLSLNILEIKHIKVANMLPAMLIMVIIFLL
ncbi:MAG: hypothetical protein ATN33_01440 [Epulopiscium sp. Nele67-Bin001]|nr:MAG: hypothetical protein ATN33_01440 [Epulopiscium sp. Nele67-Bin001]